MEITLLDNKKSIKQLVEVDINESILDTLNKELASDNYNFVITAENVPFAKKQMADLNKSIKFIDTFRKDKVSVESVAIDLFKSNVKEYLALIDAKRDEIKKNVEVFEREAKDLILKELSLYSEEFVKLQGIREDFKEVDIADLIIFGSVTSKGNLTKKAIEAIESRVMICKSKQDKYDMRLKDLEIECRRAGLEAIMTITHVQGIINLDSDAEYQTRLDELISHEIERQNAVKASVQKEADERANREAQQNVLNQQREIRLFFHFDINSLDLANTDKKIVELTHIDYSPFGDFEDFARSVVKEHLDSLEFLRNSLLEKANDLLAEMEKKEIPVVHETIPKDTPKVEEGKKVVFIDVHLQFKVKDSIPNDKIVAKVNQMLKDAGFDESLIGVEVVS